MRELPWIEKYGREMARRKQAESVCDKAILLLQEAQKVLDAYASDDALRKDMLPENTPAGKCSVKLYDFLKPTLISTPALSKKDQAWAEKVADKFERGEYKCAGCGEPLPHTAPCVLPTPAVIKTEAGEAGALANDGVWTSLGEKLVKKCGHVNGLAGNPLLWPLECCVGCARDAIKTALDERDKQWYGAGLKAAGGCKEDGFRVHCGDLACKACIPLRTLMKGIKVNHSKEWWLAKAKAEGDAAIGAGVVKDVECALTLPMVLHCPNPKCGKQHIDAPEPDKGWTNPPHKSHLCRDCGTVWRPANVFTVGVKSIARGSADTWPAKMDAPDAYCITTPDGDCVSNDPRCMHQPKPAPAAVVDEAERMWLALRYWQVTRGGDAYRKEAMPIIRAALAAARREGILVVADWYFKRYKGRDVMHEIRALAEQSAPEKKLVCPSCGTPEDGHDEHAAGCMGGAPVPAPEKKEKT